MWWIPRRIARDVWRASGPATGVWLVEARWCAWPAKTVGAGWYGVATHSGGRSYVEMVAGVVAAVLAIATVNRLTARQAR